MLFLRSESWRPWRAKRKCVPYVGDLVAWLLVLTRDAWPESKLSLAKFPAGKTSSRRQISAIKMPWFSSETSSLSQLDAVFTGSLIIVRTRCLFVGFDIMGHLVLEWQYKCLRRTQMLSLRSESWRPWRAEWKCVPYVGDRAKDARDLPNANPNSITQGDDDLGYMWLDPQHMAHIFAWHDTAVTNPTTEKIENKGSMSLWWNYSYLPEMHCRSWNCLRRRRRPRRWP